MNKFMLKTLLAAALAGALSTAAVADEPQLGLGVSVAGNNSAMIRGTVDLQSNLRLEPYLAFSYDDPSGSKSSTDLEVGSALHIMQPIKSALNGYYGGFVGIDTYDNGSNSGTIVNLGPVAGVEYAFDPQFTLGAEVRFNLGFGDKTVVNTDSSVLLRYYF